MYKGLFNMNSKNGEGLLILFRPQGFVPNLRFLDSLLTYFIIPPLPSPSLSALIGMRVGLESIFNCFPY
jgi:hypothetical protein